METFAKIADAGSMLWATLDTRERLVLGYVAVVAVALVLERVARGERERADERIAARAAQLVREGR